MYNNWKSQIILKKDASVVSQEVISVSQLISFFPNGRKALQFIV